MCSSRGRTQQQFRDECDINRILERFNVTGVLPVGSVQPTYGDFSGVFDYQSAANAVIVANQSFAALPAKIRNRFSNDPSLFLEFVQDEANAEECYQLGLLKRLEPRQESPTEAVQAEVAQGTT
jgi:phage internal scaffolding protein